MASILLSCLLLSLARRRSAAKSRVGFRENEGSGDKVTFEKQCRCPFLFLHDADCYRDLMVISRCVEDRVYTMAEEPLPFQENGKANK
ncbi:hypothetical protein IWZ01DRAFT_504104 [Phyllosticta capitalensis]